VHGCTHAPIKTIKYVCGEQKARTAGSSSLEKDSTVFNEHIEQTTHEELYGLIFTLLQQNKNEEFRLHFPLETMAQIVSWAIFGAAVQWSQEGGQHDFLRTDGR
jgi:hypothetical protein